MNKISPAEEARRSMDIVRNPRKVDFPERELCPYTQRIEAYVGGSLDLISRALVYRHLRRCESCQALLEHIAPEMAAGAAGFPGNVVFPVFAAASTLGGGEAEPETQKSTVLLHEREPRAYGVDVLKTRLADGLHWRVQVKVAPPPKGRRLTISLAKCEGGKQGANLHSVAANGLDIILPAGTYVLTFSAAQASDHFLFDLP